MKALLIVGGVLLLALLLLGGCGVGAYNSFVGGEEKIEAAWSEIHNQYQRRADLVPQLVATVQGAADFEKSTLTELTEARASVGRLPAAPPEDPAALEAYMKTQEQFAGALSRLLVVAEAYPDLKATANFRDLQTQLEGTENRIGVARRDYIDAVREYNVAIRRFPGSFVAGLTGFEARPQLETPAGVTERPAVEFDFAK
jgi:LemA protein